MADKEEQPMFDFKGSQVEKFNDNETESGTLLKDRGSSFGEMAGNRRGPGGPKKEGLISKLKWEVLKSPVGILVAIIGGSVLLFIAAWLDL
ncbi:hypothetical protein [Vreelandella venusta]|uniref:hypothetical protein n=1 Tax=Vreelandella venusta TaxID=44935 RepID=UPI0018DA944D|nr:hypothetical protein [Halomonas venusta]QPI62450.1 hypothetical protein IR195_11125 [Halomonas venusta]